VGGGRRRHHRLLALLYLLSPPPALILLSGSLCSLGEVNWFVGGIVSAVSFWIGCSLSRGLKPHFYGQEEENIYGYAKGEFSINCSGIGHYSSI
jgi:hypothetical protein